MVRTYPYESPWMRMAAHSVLTLVASLARFFFLSVTNGLPTSLVCPLVATNYGGIVRACLGDAEYTFDWDNVLVKVWTVDHENDE